MIEVIYKSCHSKGFERVVSRENSDKFAGNSCYDTRLIITVEVDKITESVIIKGQYDLQCRRRRALNILVIGNGFDLAHGLPTRYGQFLEWIVAEVEFYHILKTQQSEITNDIKDIQLNIPEKMKGKKVIDARVEHQAELWECIHKNVWIAYFLQCNMYQKEDWVDFEAEISDVITSLDEDIFMEDRTKYKIGSEIHMISNEFLKQIYGNRTAVNVRAAHYLGTHCECITYKEIRDRLECDLRNLIRALEIYLSEYVAGLECNIRLTEAAVLKPDCVLSFNKTK